MQYIQHDFAKMILRTQTWLFAAFFIAFNVMKLEKKNKHLVVK